MKEIYNILIKHFSGSTTDEEESIILGYKKNNSLEYESLKKLWLSDGKIDIINFNSQAAWEKTEHTIKNKNNNVFSNKERMLRIAVFAPVIIALLIATWFILNIMSQNDIQLYINDTNQVSKIQLSDGSSVWLNSNAELSYPDNFHKTERNVEIIGEAYFEVVGNENWPFNINTPNSEITVLGTAFDVKASETETKVIVSSGTVHVSSGDGDHNDIVESGEVANIKLSSLIVHSNVDTNFLSWQNGIFQFDGSTIHETVKDLSTYYKNQILVDSSSTFDCALTGYFSQVSLSEIIETLVLTCGVKAENDGDRYIISNR